MMMERWCGRGEAAEDPLRLLETALLHYPSVRLCVCFSFFFQKGEATVAQSRPHD